MRDPCIWTLVASDVIYLGIMIVIDWIKVFLIQIVKLGNPTKSLTQLLNQILYAI